MGDMKKLTYKHAIVMLCAFLLNVNDAFSDGSELVVAKRNVSGNVDTPPAIGEDEYIASGSFTNNKGTFQIQTYRSDDGSIEEIQFYFSINDTNPDPGDDQIRISFDLDHSETATEIDRGVRIFRIPPDGASNNVRLTNINLFANPTDLEDLPTGQWSVEPGTTTWQAEVKIRATDLGLNYIPSILGMHIRVITFNQSPGAGTYPAGVATPQINSWTNLKTRNPLNYVLLLDQSGSMNKKIDPLSTRWQAAKTASDIFVQLMHAVRSPDFNDQVGLRTYYWEAECINGEYVYIINENGFMEPIWFCHEDVTGEYVSEEESLALLGTITFDGYTDSITPPLHNPGRDWRTPIKRGLNSAFTTLGSGEREKVILLISDGFHNMPSDDYGEEPYEFPNNTGPEDFQINTIALGPDESVGTALLEDIKNEFFGFGASYISALGRKELIDAFVENLFPYFYLNRVAVSPLGHFDVNLSESKLIVMLVWFSQNDTDHGFRLMRPDGSIHGTDSGYHHYKHPTLPYEIAYYVIDEPSLIEGQWRTIKLDTEDSEVGDSAYAIFDPTVYAYFSVIQDREDFILKAVLKENGQAISENSAEVLVDVDKPNEGLGTYASITQPDCSVREPSLPIKKDTSPGLLHKKNVSMELSRILRNNTQQGPIPNYIAKIKELFRICGKEGLNRDRETTLRLYDDATHGDLVADDGIFTLKYTDTEYEGTYTFNFDASGTTSSGSRFSRIKALSKHKSTKVASGNTDSSYVDRGFVESLKHIEIYTIPRDHNNEYLGPGHKVKFKTSDGKLRGKIKDHLNGIYSQSLIYDEAKDRPVVDVIVNEQEIEKIKVFKPFELTVFVGGTSFDNALNLDDGVVYGMRLGYQYMAPLIFELELGNTQTQTTGGDSGQVFQVFANARYKPPVLQIGQWQPYVGVGVGYLFFRDFQTTDDTVASHIDAGASYEINPVFGVMLEARQIRTQGVYNLSSTTNTQVNFGLLWRF